MYKLALRSGLFIIFHFFNSLRRIASSFFLHLLALPRYILHTARHDEENDVGQRQLADNTCLLVAKRPVAA